MPFYKVEYHKICLININLFGQILRFMTETIMSKYQLPSKMEIDSQNINKFCKE